MNHKWSNKLSKKQPWAECVHCGLIKERSFECGQIYIRYVRGNDGGQSDKMWFSKAPICNGMLVKLEGKE